MSTSYPGALDSFVNPTATDTLDSATVPHAAQHDNINDAMSAVQVTLGVNPQGGSATVVARLTALDSTVAGKAATNQTMYVGTTAIAINRSSASQTLTGTSIDGNAGTVTNGVYTSTTSLPNVTSVNGTSIPVAGTLLTSATTTLPNVTSVNGTTIPATATLLTSASTNSALTSFGSSPALSGTPTTSTAAVDTNTTQVASTAFVLGQAASATPAMDGTAAVGTSTRYARADHVHGSDTSKANLSGATFTGQTSVQSASTSAVPLFIMPTGSLTFTSLTATHTNAGGTAYDTISGFSSTTGLVAGQSVVMSGFSDLNFNGTTTITLVSATTIQVTSLNSTNGTGTGGQIVVTSTQANLQEWQLNNGTAVASVSPSGVITALRFSGSGSLLTGLPGGNLNAGTVATTALASVTGTGTNVVTDTNPTITSLNASGTIYRQVSGAPTAVTTTISAAALLTMWVTSSPSTAQNTSLPTATALTALWLGGDTAVVEWTYINTGTANATLTTGTSSTIATGNNAVITAGTSARFGTRRSSGGGSYTTYRLA